MAVLQGSLYEAELVSATDLTGSTVTCQVTAPDGSITTQTATVNGTVATAIVPAVMVGIYLLVWTSSGIVLGTVQDQFTVRAPAPDLISLPDLKEELHLAATDRSKDDKLRRWLTAARDVIENVTGPIVPHTRTDTFDGGYPFVVLTARWASTITTVSEWAGQTATVLPAAPYGSALSGYVWDQRSNVITRTGGGVFAGGAGAVQVVYQAGLATIPDDVQLAAAELIRHWYRKNDVPFRSNSFNTQPTDDLVNMPGNYMVPNSVMELLEPWRRPPQVA